MSSQFVSGVMSFVFGVLLGVALPRKTDPKPDGAIRTYEVIEVSENQEIRCVHKPDFEHVLVCGTPPAIDRYLNW